VVVARERSERERILRAAFGLIGRPDHPAVSVQQILDSAGLSTRAFYRHFPSKDELLVTMCRTAADRVAAETAEVIAAADGPAEAMRAWIHHQLAVIYEPRRAAQTAVLSSPEARSAVGFERVSHEAWLARRSLLADVLRRGRDAGVLPAVTDPDADAHAVASVVNGVVQASLAGEPMREWEEVTEHTTGLFLRAFRAR
jgi:AcrR family transcriptional regulator